MRSLIFSLLFRIRPNTIFGAVWSFIILAVNRGVCFTELIGMLLVCDKHICFKVFKIMPSVTNSDTARPAPLECRLILLIATAHHCVPNAPEP